MTEKKQPMPPELRAVFGPLLDQMMERTDLHHLLPPKQRRLIEALMRERVRVETEAGADNAKDD